MSIIVFNISASFLKKFLILVSVTVNNEPVGLQLCDTAGQVMKVYKNLFIFLSRFNLLSKPKFFMPFFYPKYMHPRQNIQNL